MEPEAVRRALISNRFSALDIPAAAIDRARMKTVSFSGHLQRAASMAAEGTG